MKGKDLINGTAEYGFELTRRINEIGAFHRPHPKPVAEPLDIVAEIIITIAKNNC
jgi:hypothetical protein